MWLDGCIVVAVGFFFGREFAHRNAIHYGKYFSGIIYMNTLGRLNDRLVENEREFRAAEATAKKCEKILTLAGTNNIIFIHFRCTHCLLFIHRGIMMAVTGDGCSLFTYGMVGKMDFFPSRLNM